MDRFWAKVGLGAVDECWQWLGARTSKGYGSLSRGKRGDGAIAAHCVAYRWAYGPVPDGLQVDHLCRNRACVNPLHLEAVTNRVNVLRGRGETASNARKTHCRRGHPLSGRNLYMDPRGRRECRACRTAAYRRHNAKARNGGAEWQQRDRSLTAV